MSSTELRSFLVQVKTTCQSPQSVLSDYVMVPESILSANQYMTLFGDIFFINKVPFFATISDQSVTISSSLLYTEHIANRKLKQLVLASLHVQAIYAAHDFKIKVIIMDGTFVPLKHDLATAGIVLNTTLVLQVTRLKMMTRSNHLMLLPHNSLSRNMETRGQQRWRAMLWRTWQREL